MNDFPFYALFGLTEVLMTFLEYEEIFLKLDLNIKL